MTSGYYGRTVTVSGEFSRRLHVVYLLLRQVNLKTAVYQVFVTATCPLVDSVIYFPQRLAKISAGYWWHILALFTTETAHPGQLTTCCVERRIHPSSLPSRMVRAEHGPKYRIEHVSKPSRSGWNGIRASRWRIRTARRAWTGIILPPTEPPRHGEPRSKRTIFRKHHQSWCPGERLIPLHTTAMHLLFLSVYHPNHIFLFLHLLAWFPLLCYAPLCYALLNSALLCSALRNRFHRTKGV